MLKFSKNEKEIGKKIYQKFVDFKLKNPGAPLISFKYLYKILNKEETALIKKIISVDPKDYGKNYVVFYGIGSVPKNLVALKNQKYFSHKDKKIKKVRTQFLPNPVFRAFLKMKKAMQRDLGRTINVTSGYRSPAYQVLILFLVIFENSWNLRRALSRITLPGWSEHGYPKKQAIDVAPIRGIRELENFDKTKEYKWLLKNAAKFGFFLSFPRGNKFGVMFEPWHWHYIDN